MSSRWLDGFVKWFFNASPLWVDERELEASREATRLSPLRDRRAANGERRREPREEMLHLQRRRGS